MKILIAGAGAVGCAFGGFLRKSGLDITMVGRGSHFDSILQKGLSISGIWGEHQVNGFAFSNDFSSLKGPFDAILCCVKSFDTYSTALSFRHLIGPQTIIVSLQNGLGNVEEIYRASECTRILGGRVIFGITRPAPATINITVYTEPVMIGFPVAWRPKVYTRNAELAQKLADLIEASGIPCRYTEDIEKYQWSKFLYSSALNPLSAINRVTYGELAEKAEWRKRMDNVIKEIFAIAVAKRIPLFWTRPEDFMRVFYTKLIPDTARHRSSMLQDIEAGRKTEIESLCGITVRYGEEFSVPVPENESLLFEMRNLVR
ncbi:MAG: 2-dehydropantoate 2-reductase [Fibrobacteres bacterium]|nr:2-dehydropantoate 2-reductase [Fibrobacterota bacterium]